MIVIIGQVTLPGRSGNDWSGASVMVEESGQSAVTGSNGNFTLNNVSIDNGLSLKADAPGYLPARCTLPSVSQPQVELASTALLSGDVNDDAQVDITDAVAIGLDFGATGPDLLTDINRTGNVDIFDVILLGINFGRGTQTWDCMAK